MRTKLGLLGILIVMLVAVASAAPPWQQNEKPQITEKPQIGKPDFENTDKNYQKAKDWFDKTKKNIEEAKKNIEEVRKQAEEKRFEAWKKHLQAWVEVAKRWVERVQMRVENMNVGNETKERLMNRLNMIESRLDEIENRIDTAQNYTELRGVAAEIKGMWGELKQGMRAVAHEYAVEKYERFLERLIQVRDRLEAAGVNVSELDAKIEEINESVEELKNYTGTPEFAEKVREINQLFGEAFEIVKELAREARPEYHTGFVYAYVNGSFELSGNFSSVQIKGDGNVTIPEEVIVTKVDTPGVKMIIAMGNFTATGEGELRILAHGSGELILNGEGYYRVKQTPTGPMTEEIWFGNETVSVTFG